MEHTFAIPVYRAAPNLAALIESLRAQTKDASEILLTTSTPSTELDSLAKRYALPLYINPQRIDISSDWNFALKASRSTLVTIAHQDDLYAPDYVSQLSRVLCRYSDALLAFCDYSEHTSLGVRPTNINLRVKRVLRHRAFRGRECIGEPRDKLRLLSFGNPICCPSVMLNRKRLADFRFPAGLQSNLDWMAWLELARQPGGFIYVHERLVSKGVHSGSETTATIASRAREREDRALFDAIWPRPIAAALSAVYKFAHIANRV